MTSATKWLRVLLGVEQHGLVRHDDDPQIDLMGARIFDFSHLTPAERIELAEQLWDSLEPESEGMDEALATDLRRRRAELRADGDFGLDGSQVLDEIATRKR